MANVQLGKVGLTPKDLWSSSLEYEKLDIVVYDGESYIAKKNVPVGVSVTTGTEYWQLFSEKGNGMSVGKVISVTTTQPLEAENKLWIREGYDEEFDVLTPDDIDDTAGEGDDDVVWSADKTWNEINYLQSKSDKNKFDCLKYDLKYHLTDFDLKPNSIRVASDGNQGSYSHLEYYIQLKPSTKYMFSCRRHINNYEMTGWIGLAFASSSTPTYPLSNEVLFRNTTINVQDTLQLHEFTTNEYGWTRINIYVNGNAGEAGDITFYDLMLAEGYFSGSYEPNELVEDHALRKSLPSAENFFVPKNVYLWDNADKNCTKIEYYQNGFRFYNDRAIINCNVGYLARLKPNTTYTLKMTLNNQPKIASVQFANITETGAVIDSNYIFSNNSLSSTPYINNEEVVSFFTTSATGCIRLLFYGNGATAALVDVTVTNISLYEGLLDNPATSKFRAYNMITGNTNINILPNGFRLYSGESVRYQMVQFVRKLKPNTDYIFRATRIDNQEQELHGWVGYAESSDEGSTYPAGNNVIIRNNDSVIPEIEKEINFKTTTGYTVFRFYANGNIAETCDTSWINVSLEEGKKIYELSENLHAKSEIDTLNRHPHQPGTMTIDKNEVNLLVFSDIHHQPDRTERIKQLVNNWGREYFDGVLCCGDIPVNVISTDNLAWYYNALDGLCVPLLNTVGNHDVYGTNSGGTLEYVDKSETYAKLIEPIVFTSAIVQPTGASKNYNCYYYKDFNNSVRVIVIDCMRWDSDQAAWMQSVLANARTSGLHVLCSSHIAFNGSEFKERVDCKWSNNRGLTTWVTTPVSNEPAELINNFINAGGIFICWIHGHTHWDTLERTKNLNQQFMVVLGGDTIQQQTMMVSENSQHYTYDLLTYASIDTTNRFIMFHRIGANQFLHGGRHNGISIDYGNNRLYADW